MFEQGPRHLETSLLSHRHISDSLRKQLQPPRGWERPTNQFLCLSPHITPPLLTLSSVLPLESSEVPWHIWTPPQDLVPDPRARCWNLMSRCFSKTSHHIFTHTYSINQPPPSSRLSFFRWSCCDWQLYWAGRAAWHRLFKSASLIWACPVALWHLVKRLWLPIGATLSCLALSLEHTQRSPTL